MLVIYGGRNDTIFKMTNNVALNDICLFNLQTFTWESLAMFGQTPCSRWSHCMIAQDSKTNSASKGFLIFGGVNLTTYCKNKIQTFEFHELKKHNIDSAINLKEQISLRAAIYISSKQTKLATEVKKRINILRDICNNPDLE